MYSPPKRSRLEEADLPPEEPTTNNVDSNFVQSLVVAQTQSSTSKAIAQALTAKDNPTLPIKGVLATWFCKS